MRMAAWYGIGVGALMLLQWGFFLLTGNVPELRTEPWRIAFHLAAEFVTAAALLWSGAGLLRARTRARSAYLVAVGMVIYSEIASPGYFAQQGQWALVAMFAVLLVLALASVRALIRHPV